MSDEEWSPSDYASTRAAALLDLAANYDEITNKEVRARMLRAMDLLNDGIERIVRPKAKQRAATLLPLKGGFDDAS